MFLLHFIRKKMQNVPLTFEMVKHTMQWYLITEKLFWENNRVSYCNTVTIGYTVNLQLVLRSVATG